MSSTYSRQSPCTDVYTAYRSYHNTIIRKYPLMDKERSKDLAQTEKQLWEDFLDDTKLHKRLYSRDWKEHLLRKMRRERSSYTDHVYYSLKSEQPQEVILEHRRLLAIYYQFDELITQGTFIVI